MTSKKGLPEEFELARANLRPRLWLRAPFEQMRLNAVIEGASAGSNGPPSEAIRERLIANFLYDLPEAVQVIGEPAVPYLRYPPYLLARLIAFARTDDQDRYGTCHGSCQGTGRRTIAPSCRSIPTPQHFAMTTRQRIGADLVDVVAAESAGSDDDLKNFNGIDVALRERGGRDTSRGHQRISGVTFCDWPLPTLRRLR